MTRGIAHAITVVIAGLVAGFSLLFILSRVQDEDAPLTHPLDFLMEIYGATDVVWTFFFVAIIWIAFFVALTELVGAISTNRGRALRNAILIELAALCVFFAAWYWPAG